MPLPAAVLHLERSAKALTQTRQGKVTLFVRDGLIPLLRNNVTLSDGAVGVHASACIFRLSLIPLGLSAVIKSRITSRVGEGTDRHFAVTALGYKGRAR